MGYWLNVIVLLAGMLWAGAPAAGQADVTFGAGDWPEAREQWRPDPAAAWQVQKGRGDEYLQNTAGTGATLTHALDVPRPWTFAVDYGWRFGQGAAGFEVELTDAGEAITVAVSQKGGPAKYEVRGPDGQVLARAAGDADPGAAVGGRNHAGTFVLTLGDDGTLTVGPLRGEPTRAEVGDFRPRTLTLRDVSPNNEGLRLSRLRLFAGDAEPQADLGALRMPIGGLFVEGETPELWLEPTWIGGGERRLEATIAVTALAGDAPALTLRREATIRSGGRLDLSPEGAAQLEPGMYRATVKIDGREIAGRFAVASAELAAVPRDEIPGWVGVVPYLNVMPRDTYAESFDFLAKMGVRHVRWLPGWGRLEPERDQYDWSETDLFMDLCARHDITAMFCLSYYGAKWTGPASNGDQARSDQGRALWVEHFAVPTMERYGDRVKQWQIWNEPDAFWNDDPAKVTGFARGFGSSSNYYDLLRRTHEAAQSVGHDDLLVMSSLASGGQKEGIPLLFGYGLGGRFDGIVLHTYGNHLRHLLDADALLTDLGQPDAPVAVGETGIPTADDLPSELRQVNKVIEVMLQSAVADHALDGKLMGVDYFVLHDLVANARFGLLDADLQPQPAVLGYHTVARLLAGAGAAEFDSFGDVRIYRVEREGRPPLVGLVAGGGTSSVTIEVGDGAAAPTAWDWAGRRAELDVDAQTRTATVELGDVMTFVEGDVAVRVPPAVTMTPTFADDGTPVLNVLVKGGGGEAALEIDGMDSPAPQAVTAGEATQFALPDAEAATVYGMTLSLSGDGGTIGTFDATAEWTAVPAVSPEAADSLTPPAELETYELSGVENYTHFKGDYAGDADNSATLAFAQAGDALIVWIDQRDDVHVAPPAHAPWSQDGPQIALAPDAGRSPSTPHVEFALGISRDEGPIIFVPGQPHYTADLLAERDEAAGRTRYRATIPLGQFQVAADGGGPTPIGFALILNDSDGDGRKGWLGWGEGIGTEKNPAKYRQLILTGSPPADGDAAPATRP